jgi:hypothetical protein
MAVLSRLSSLSPSERFRPYSREHAASKAGETLSQQTAIIVITNRQETKPASRDENRIADNFG